MKPSCCLGRSSPTQFTKAPPTLTLFLFMCVSLRVPGQPGVLMSERTDFPMSRRMCARVPRSRAPLPRVCAKSGRGLKFHGTVGEKDCKESYLDNSDGLQPNSNGLLPNSEDGCLWGLRRWFVRGSNRGEDWQLLAPSF